MDTLKLASPNTCYNNVYFNIMQTVRVSVFFIPKPLILSHVCNAVAWPYEMRYIKSYCYFGIYNLPAFMFSSSITLVFIIHQGIHVRQFHFYSTGGLQKILFFTNGIKVIPLVPIVPMDEQNASPLSLKPTEISPHYEMHFTN